MAVSQSDLNSVLSAAQGSMVAASGTITISATNVSEDDTVTVNGIVYTFKDEPSATRDVDVGSDNDESAANLHAKLAASTSASLKVASYSVTDNVITITYKVPGTVGNAFTLAKSGSEISLSAATLENGADTGATDYASTDVAAGEVLEARQDDAYEKNILALIASAEAAITLGADPSTSATTTTLARRQRRVLKTVLQVLAGAIPAVANSDADDRATIATYVREKALRRYNKDNRDSDLN